MSGCLILVGTVLNARPTAATPFSITVDVPQVADGDPGLPFIPIAPLYPGDVISGMISYSGTGGSATIGIEFQNKIEVRLGSAFYLPNAGMQGFTAYVDQAPSGLPPTDYNFSFGTDSSTRNVTYPNGNYFPAGTERPVLGILANSSMFGSGTATISGDISNPSSGAPPCFRCPTAPGDTQPETGPPTVQQLVRLAGASYQETPPATAGYIPIQTYRGAGGFGATLFSNMAGDQLVLSVRGTSAADDRTSAYTLVSDLAFLANTPTVPLVDSVNALARVVRDIADDIAPGGKYYVPVPSEGGTTGPQLTITGYSLGGALAQVVGNGAHIETVTFLSPGPEQFHLDASADVSSLGSLGIASPSSTVVDYRQWGDLVSLPGEHVGQQITADNPAVPDFQKTLLGVPALAGNVALNWGNFHSLDLLTPTLDAGPTVPGIVGANEVLGVPDRDVLQNLVLGPATSAVLAIYNVPKLERGAVAHFDPRPGYGYELTLDAGSPELRTLRLPTDGTVAGWSLDAYGPAGLLGHMLSYFGNFDLPDGVTRVDFHPVDQSGNPVYEPTPFFFDASFARDGDVNASVRTFADPLGDDPGGPMPVPEPASAALFGLGVAALACLHRRRATPVRKAGTAH